MTNYTNYAQIITKGKQLICKTIIPYPPDIVRAMKKAGYKVKDVKEVQNDE